MTQDNEPEADEFLARPITHAADLSAALADLDAPDRTDEERALVRIAIRHCREIMQALDEIQRLTAEPSTEPPESEPEPPPESAA